MENLLFMFCALSSCPGVSSGIVLQILNMFQIVIFAGKKISAKYGNFLCFPKDPELDRIACFQLWRKDISQENWNA